ncbi:tRNA (cytidine(34)-2'-O)-methyltransferase [Roseateles violae]|uniref:tRNA (cytidine(34)-2'-O)-methyltransferase n=1 Tax=Roseateles violae TaxID=3058042 RepID=A0ABT8DRR2_9BURK|nr:tRNA (cytidine(34)-2'-O)-methyltransferase [Pelomonas sp. PFR6]MDN3921011.1 tRNA (cytidine(34)-2'-O)-methyltransferase [Pelomonas sp. PFR6]
MFHIVLVQPEIPPNTGNIIRLAANTGCTLHLIEPLGFSMEDKLLQRAGLDYHEYAPLQRHANWEAFLASARPDPARLFAFTTRGSRPLGEMAWRPGDYLVFGSETAGLAPELRERFPEGQRVRLPMRPGQRSLNLSNSVAVAVFDAWRQNGYAGGG